MRVSELASRARFTVLVFFGQDCHCQVAHEPRLAALAAALKSRGVQFFWVDSEEGPSGPPASAEVPRGLSFPLLVDPGGQVARTLGARYATYSVILDSHGAIRYRGAIDSDRVHLTVHPTLYLADALEDCLGGREPQVYESEALGCNLRLP